MIHLPMVDKKITEIMNDGESYVVGIEKDKVSIYKEIEARIFPFRWLFDESKIGFIVNLIDNKHFTDDEDIETIKVVFDVRDNDIEEYRMVKARD